MQPQTKATPNGPFILMRSASADANQVAQIIDSPILQVARSELSFDVGPTGQSPMGRLVVGLFCRLWRL